MSGFMIPRRASGARSMEGAGSDARCWGKALARWLVAGVVAAACLPGHAAINTLTFKNSYDGTPGWDPDPGPGLDTGPDNRVVRTNDQFEYVVTFATDGGGDDDLTLVSTLPLGDVAPRVGERVVRWTNLPANCTGEGSGISADGLTLTCNVGNIQASGTQSVYFNATVLGSTPNGTALPAPSLSARSSATSSFSPTETPQALTVTAAPFYDVVIQMSHHGNPRAYGFMPGGGPAGEDGFFHRPLVGLVAKNPNGNGNKGVEQLDPAVPVHYDIDLSGYPDGVRLDNWHPTATGTFATGCGSPSKGGPHAASGGNFNMHFMVSDAGGDASTSPQVVPNGGVCTGAAQVGKGVNFDVTGIDTSLQRRPTTAGNSGVPVPPSEWWVSNKGLVLWTPLSDYPADTNIDHVISLGSVSGTSISGQPMTGDDPANNSASYELRTANTGTASKAFVDDLTPAEPTLRTHCDPTNIGDCRVNFMTAAQSVRGRVIYSNTGTETHHGVYVCEIIDRTAFDIGPNFAASWAWGNITPTPPAPTIRYGVKAGGPYFDSTDAAIDPYTGGPVGSSAYAQARCNDPTIRWFNTHAAAEENGGLVYVQAVVPEVKGGASGTLRVNGLILRSTWAATIEVQSPTPATRVARQPIPEGTILRNEADIGSPLPSLDGVSLRDHLQVVQLRTTARVTKAVADPADAQTAPQGVGSTITYRLQPRYSTYFPLVPGTVTVTDILPPHLAYQAGSATVGGVAQEPEVFLDTPAAGYTRLVWTLPNQMPYSGADGAAANLSPIEFRATIGLRAPDSTVLPNSVAVSGGATDYVADCAYDVASQSFGRCLKAASANLTVQTPPGFRVQKTTLTPQIEPGQNFGYRVSYASFGAAMPQRDVPEFIDILPFVGDGASNAANSFTGRTPASKFEPGAYQLIAVTPPANDPGMTVYYTQAAPASIHNDPRHPSNAIPAGSTRWCTAAQLGAAGCPASIGQSTAVRVKPGVTQLAASEVYSVDITLRSSATVAKRDDVFANSVGGRSPDPTSELAFVSARANAGVVVTGGGGSVAGLVFIDDNDDGVRDAGEAGLGGVLITLEGCVAGPDGALNTAAIPDSGALACAGDDVPVTRTLTTGADGLYRFDNLPSGLYRITQTQPADYRDGKRSVGSAGGTANAQGTVPSVITDIPLGANVSASGYDFAELRQSAVTVAKLADPASGTNVAAGQTITYTVRVTVADAATEHEVTLTDTLGAGLELVAGSLPAGGACTAAGQVVTCTLAADAAVGDHDFSYQATVAADTTAAVDNTVVPSGGGDPACNSADDCRTSHPVGAGAGGGVTPVPVNAPWALLLLSVLLGGLAHRSRRKR